MRVLYCPMYSSPRNLRTCSTYSWARIFFPRLLHSREDVFLYFGLPEGVDFHEEWMDHPRCEIYRLPLLDDQITQSVTVDQVMVDRFREFDGPTPVDIVFMDKSIPLPQYRALSETINNPSRRVYAVNMHFDFVPGETKVSDNVFSLQSLGCAGAEVMIAHDKGSAKRILNTARKYIGPKQAARLLDNTHVGCGYFDTELFQSIYREEDKPVPPPFVVNWGCGFNATYRVEEIIGAIKKAIATGEHDIRLLVTSSSSSPGAHSEVLDGCSFLASQNWRLPRPEFYGRLNNCHISIYWAWREQFSGSQLEQAAFGLLGIYNDRFPPPWVPKNYPYLFSGEQDLPAVILEAVKHYNDPLTKRMLKEIQEKILAEYSGQTDADILRERCFAEVPKKKDYVGWCQRMAWLIKMVDQLVPPYDEVDFETMRHRIKDIGTKGIWVGAREGYKGTWVGCDDLRDAMICCGWQDTHKTKEPVFVFKPETRIAPANEDFEARVKLSRSRGAAKA